MNIYFIGGSPCAGKSTVADILSKKYDMYYFKVDDYLDEYIQKGASKGYEICTKQTVMNAEQIWMRDPELQCDEEIRFYGETFEFALEDLRKISCERDIIAEGAAYLPKLMKQISVQDNRYISITPAPEFQLYHYSKREFVPYVLEGCSDKKQAFKNWMDRDILFAKEVQRQCAEAGYVSLVNNGELSVDELVDKVTMHFELGV